MSKEAVKGNYDQIMRNLADRVESVSLIHYRHAVGEISRLIGSEGQLPTGIALGGPQTVHFHKLNGSRGSVRTGYWAPLTEAYAERKPFSFQYWRKFSNRKGSLGRRMAMTIGPNKAKVRTNILKSPRSHHKDRVNAGLNIWFHNLPRPLHTMITRPFATGVDFDDHYIEVSSKGKRFGLKRLFPEMGENRPFIGRVSARLGNEMRKKLRKL